MDLKHLHYYSVNSWLSYHINEKYYKNIHYVWVAPYFDAISNPASSNPMEIFLKVIKSTNTKDGHCDYIERNKTGIMNGAHKKFDLGIISADHRDEIISIVMNAEKNDFTPLIYIIPTSRVRKIIDDVPIAEKANPFSKEWKIEKLKRKDFDIIEFKTWL